MGQSLLLQTVDTRKNSFVILRNKDLELNRKKLDCFAWIWMTPRKVESNFKVDFIKWKNQSEAPEEYSKYPPLSWAAIAVLTNNILILPRKLCIFTRICIEEIKSLQILTGSWIQNLFCDN